MTSQDLITRLVQIGMTLRENQETLLELSDYYATRIANRELRCLIDDDTLIGFVDFRWIPEPLEAMKAYLNQKTEGPCLYIKTVYLRPGSAHLIWKLRALLPFHNVCCGHHQQADGTLALRTHWRPYAIPQAV